MTKGEPSDGGRDRQGHGGDRSARLRDFDRMSQLPSEMKFRSEIESRLSWRRAKWRLRGFSTSPRIESQSESRPYPQPRNSGRDKPRSGTKPPFPPARGIKGRIFASETSPLAVTRVLLASPAAKRIAKEKGIDLASLKGSGPDGAVFAEDVATRRRHGSRRSRRGRPKSKRQSSLRPCAASSASG